MPGPGEINKERKSISEINTAPNQPGLIDDQLNQSFDDGLMRTLKLEEAEQEKEQQEEEQSFDFSKMKNTFASIFSGDDAQDEEQNKQKLDQTRREVARNMPPEYERLNRAFDRERTDDFLNEKVTAGYDMEKAKESYARQFGSIQKTERDVAEISTLLSKMDTDKYEPVEKDARKAKLSAIRGRKLSHLMLNDQKLTGDSELMEKVKEEVHSLEIMMTAKQRHALTVKNVDFICGQYRTAIDACRTYCKKKNPWLPAGKRRKAKVEATLKRLMAEYDAVQVARFTVQEGGSEAAQVTTGIQLLSLTASQKLADTLRNRKREEDNAAKKEGFKREEKVLERDLRSKNEELETAEEIHAATQLSMDAKLAEIPGYSELKEECALLQVQFDELYKEVGFAGLNMPSYFGGNDEIKKLDKKLKEKKEKLEEMEDVLSADEEYKRLKSLISGQKGDIDRLKADIRDIELRVMQTRNKYNEIDAGERDRLRKEKEKLESAKKTTAARRKDEIGENDKKLASLPKELEPAIRLLVSGQEPTSIIRNKKKISDKERATLSSLLEVRKALSAFEKGTQMVQSLDLAGGVISLIQDQFGNVTVKCGDTEIPVSNLAKQSAGAIADDVMKNQSVYGDEAVYNVILDAKTDLTQMSRGDLLRTREHCAQVLFRHAGLPKTLMNNIKVDELRSMALEVLEKKDDKEAFTKLKKDLSKRVESYNNMKKTSYINTQLNQELQQTGEQIKEGVVINIEKKAVKDGWDEREQPVLDLVADLISMKDTWKSDEVQVKRGERIKKVLLDNAGAIALIISDQFRDKEEKPEGLVEGIVDKLPLFAFGEKGLADLKNGLKDALVALRSFVEENLDQFGDQKKTAEWALKNMPTMLTPMIKKMIEQKLTPKKTKALSDVEDMLDQVVSRSMNGVQEAFDKCIGDVFETKEEKKEEQKEEQREVQEEEHKEEHKEEQEAEHKEGEEKEEEKKELTDEEKAAEAEKKRIEQARSIVASNTKKLNDTQQKISNSELELVKLTKIRTDLEASNDQGSMAIQIKIDGIENQIDIHKKNIEKLRSFLPGYEEKIRNNKKIVEAAAKKERMAAIQKRIDDRKAIFRIYESSIESSKAQIAQYRFKIKLSAFDKMKLKGIKAGLNPAINALEEERKKTAGELNKVIEDSVKGGKSGQSLFMKNVLTTYFKSMPVIDQRSMLASAIRNSRPVPKLSDDEMKDLSDDQKLELMSDMVGGMFKGAGPLFQKMLQGLPIKSLPKGLRKAVEDTQDSLAPIPEEVVRAHMESIRERSNGKIEKIEVNQSLGAASVGQAFLCKIYGPDMKDGKNVVVKILRPDARNRMMREKEIMLEAARMTDEAGMHPFEVAQKRKNKVMGGMEATYTGNLQRIEEELDLNIEAKNCREGQVYDDRVYDKSAKQYKDNVSDSMKLSDLVDPTSDTCMMEIAGTKTVKRYMSDVNDEVERLLWKYCNKEKEKDSEGKETGREVLKKNEDGSYSIRTNLSEEELLEFDKVQNRMKEMLTDMEKRQVALAQLTEKWVTQGIFEKGYYHGDLHAGNIMISDTGVTVIDFGNATILKPEEQKQIIRMMVAATRGDVEKFRHGFHMLLKNTPEEVYQEKRDELTLMLEDIMQTGSERSAAERIAAALVRAQEMGLELPPTIANFSSCQMRLQNTLNDMNNNLKTLRLNTSNVLGTSSSTEDQRQLDPIKAVRYENRAAKAETFKRNIDEELELRNISFLDEEEQEIRKQLRDKTKRDDIRSRFKLKNVDKKAIAALDAELKKLDDLLTGREKLEPLSEEQKEEFIDDGSEAFDRMFPALASLRESQTDGINRRFVTLFMQKMEKMFFDVDNAPEVHDEFVKSDPILKHATSLENVIKAYTDSPNMKMFKNCSLKIEATETETKLQNYYDALDRKAPKEEIETLENEVWLAIRGDRNAEIEENKKSRKDNMLWKLPLEEGMSEELLIKQYNHVKQAIDSCIKEMADSTLLKEKSDKLYALCDKWMSEDCKIEDAEKKAEKLEELKAVYDEVFELVWSAQQEILQKMKAEAKDAYAVNTKDPNDFLEVMGGVMYDKKGSVALMLDPVTSMQVIWEEIKNKLFGVSA